MSEGVAADQAFLNGQPSHVQELPGSLQSDDALCDPSASQDPSTRRSVTFLAGHGEICPPRMGDPHGDPQTSRQHADPHGFLVYGFLSKGTKSMWIGVLWAGLRVTMRITHVGGKFAMAC